jgi:outer membrane protein assembly factor BamA
LRIHSVSMAICGLLVLALLKDAGAAMQKEKPEKYPRITDIEVRGNELLNRASILSNAGLKIGNRATPSALATARRNMLQTGAFGMRRAGNPEDAVKFTVIKINKAANEARLIISVEENEVIKGIDITGYGPVSPKEIYKLIQSKPNTVLNNNTLRADVERIQKYYDSKGYIGVVQEEGFGLKQGILTIPIVVGKVGMVKTSGGIIKTKKRIVKRAEEEIRRSPQTNGTFD